jgi:hypothetical protein
MKKSLQIAVLKLLLLAPWEIENTKREIEDIFKNCTHREMEGFASGIEAK